MNEIESRVRRVVANSLARPETSVHLNSKLVEDLGADPWDMIDILMDLEDEFEDEFGVALDNDKGYDCRTVLQLVEAVKAWMPE